MKKLLSIVALTLLALLGLAPAALASPPTDIVVEDTAGVLYQPQLLPALAELDFYKPTKVAIYTRRGKPGEELNEEVLRFARSNHPEWLSADGQKWADGLFIFALDVENRKVGTYMGEDRKVSQSKQDAIQNASKPDFKLAVWTDGTIAGVKKGASLINQSWYRSTFFTITSFFTGTIAVLGFGAWFGYRARNRKRAADHLKRGDASFASVSLDLPVTELNANTIPEESSYGARVLEKYRNFNSEYRQVADLNEQAHALNKKELSKKGNVDFTQRYADKAVELDGLDDVIADTNRLLNKFSGWEEAWDRQLAPLREDLDSLPALLNQKQCQGVVAATLWSFYSRAENWLPVWAEQIGTDQISPEAALDQLADARAELQGLMNSLAGALVAAYARTSAEADKMRTAMEHERERRYGYGQPNILGTVLGLNAYYSVSSFDHSYASARSTVNSSRASSGGGSSTGYGSSGGSFSGSGSSSSF